MTADVKELIAKLRVSSDPLVSIETVALIEQQQEEIQIAEAALARSQLAEADVASLVIRVERAQAGITKIHQLCKRGDKTVSHGIAGDILCIVDHVTEMQSDLAGAFATNRLQQEEIERLIMERDAARNMYGREEDLRRNAEAERDDWHKVADERSAEIVRLSAPPPQTCECHGLPADSCPARMVPVSRRERRRETE